MRLMSIVTLIFLFNTAFMPVLGAAHEQSHQAREGVTQVAWADDQSSNGLFQIIHDDHRTQETSSNSSGHSGDHQCHHVSVMGMVNFSTKEPAFDHQSHNTVEPLFLLKSFPDRIEYPPKNT